MTATLHGVAPDQQAQPASTARRVLMLTHRLPYPPDRGDRIRSYHLLKCLSRHFDLSIACTSDEPVWLQHHQLLRTMASRVGIQPISNSYSRVKGVGAMLAGRPITPTCHYRQGLADTIMQWHEQQPFDAVLVFCTGMIYYARLLTQLNLAKLHHENPKAAQQPKMIMDLVDVDSMKWESYAHSSWPPLSWAFNAEAHRLRHIEAGHTDHFDAVTVVSEAEANAYRKHVGDHQGLTVVRNGVNLEYFCPQPDPNNHAITFVGVLNYRPNYEGITWFVQHVMPLLRKRLPDVKLSIVGRHPTPAVQELGRQPGIQVVGSVPDVRTYIRDSSAIIAPLQIARGVQNKVLEAMACQRAVVCSHGAAQGIDATDGQHLLVADSPQQWVDQLHRVLTDKELRCRIASQARARVEQGYSWEQALDPMVKLLSN